MDEIARMRNDLAGLQTEMASLQHLVAELQKLITLHHSALRALEAPAERIEYV